MRRNWRAAGLVAGAGTGGLALALWWRTHPSACPYAQRLWLLPPRPFITRKRLLALLAPQPGERILDVGVGTGYYALDVADRVQPNGIVCALDLQPKMLERTGTRARQRELTNIELTVGDARALPYPDGQFDGVYLVTVLGEVPDQAAALREAHRVLRPSGRLVVGGHRRPAHGPDRGAAATGRRGRLPVRTQTGPPLGVLRPLHRRRLAARLHLAQLLVQRRDHGECREAR